jgi:integrase
VDEPRSRIFNYSRHTVNRWWDELARVCGIACVTLHGFRATFITMALDAGVPPSEVQKLVGHSHLTTTMRNYRNREASRTGADAIGRALGLNKGTVEEALEADHGSSHSGRSAASSTGP